MKILVLATVLLLTACAGANPATGTIKRQIENQMPGVEFEHDSHFALGGIALWAAKGIVRLVEDVDEEARVYLRSIDRVVVDTYRVRGSAGFDGEVTMPQVLADKIGEDGWQLMVRSREAGESTWVLVDKPSEERIDGMYVVALDQQELTLVYLRGRIDTILAQALADEPGMFVGGF